MIWKALLFAWPCLRSIISNSWLEACFLGLVSRMPGKRKVTECCFLPCLECSRCVDVRWVLGFRLQWGRQFVQPVKGKWNTQFPGAGKSFQGDPQIPLLEELLWHRKQLASVLEERACKTKTNWNKLGFFGSHSSFIQEFVRETYLHF